MRSNPTSLKNLVAQLTPGEPAPINGTIDDLLGAIGPRHAVVIKPGPPAAVVSVHDWDQPCDLFPTDDFIEGPHHHAAE